MPFKNEDAKQYHREHREEILERKRKRYLLIKQKISEKRKVTRLWKRKQKTQESGLIPAKKP
jgi:hypothetical protein